MKLKIVCCLLFVVGSISFAQNSREAKLQQLKNREDIKVREVEPNLLKLEYPNGKVLYKDINDYKPKTGNKTTYSPTFDSTIIDLKTIDTTLYYQKYSYWQEVLIGNYRTIIAGDINNNGRPELYGQTKGFTTGYSDIKAFEMNQQGGCDSVYNYDTTNFEIGIFDIDKDGKYELNLNREYIDVQPDTNIYNAWTQRLFYSKSADITLATDLSFIFQPVLNENSQQNDNYFGDWDGDEFTDQIYIRDCCPHSLYVYEYNPAIPNFDSVYYYDLSTRDLYYGGFSIGDFDQDKKTEFFAASVHGKVICFENIGNNAYGLTWTGNVETYNAYLLTETNDLDNNGKDEIWIGGQAFYNNEPKTRITLFESTGNNNYQAVGRIDFLGVFSFDAFNIQKIDVDKDGKDEVLVVVGDYAIILKFNGSIDHQAYDIFYLRRNNWEINGYNVEGATLYDLNGDNKPELIINMNEYRTIYEGRLFTHIFKGDYTVNVEENLDLTPIDYALYPCFPNPFNPQTSIKFNIAKTSFVKVKVFNSLGKELTTLLEKEMSPGNYTINWEAKDSNGTILPSGVYLIRMIADNYTKTIKALLLK